MVYYTMPPAQSLPILDMHHVGEHILPAVPKAHSFNPHNSRKRQRTSAATSVASGTVEEALRLQIASLEHQLRAVRQQSAGDAKLLKNAEARIECSVAGFQALSELLQQSEAELAQAHADYAMVISSQQDEIDEWESWFVRLQQILGNRKLLDLPVSDDSSDYDSDVEGGSRGMQSTSAASTASNAASVA